MNLLKFQNRFEGDAITSENIANVNGYSMALIDLVDYLKELTEWKPEKRMVDAVTILDTITETNDKLRELHNKTANELSKLKTDFGGEKVNSFLESVKNDPDDLKGVFN